MHHLRKLISSQHCKVAGCALIFLYNHIDAFPEPLRIDSLQWLHRDLFHELAMHWSRVVRAAFMYVVYLKGIHFEPRMEIVRGSGSTSSLGWSCRTATSHGQRMGLGSPKRCPSVDNLVAHAGASEGLYEALSESGANSDAFISGAEPIATRARSFSSTNLQRIQARDVEYSILKNDFEESLRKLQQLASTHAPHADVKLCTRVAYARLSWDEYVGLQSKWEELQEATQGHNSSSDDLGGRERSRLADAVPTKRQLVLSMSILSDTSDDDEDSVDEW